MRKPLIGLIVMFMTLLSAPATAEIWSIEVWGITEYEVKHLETQVTLPAVTVNIIPWGAYLGFTTYNTNKYSIYLRSEYKSVEEAHFVVAHEFGHVWLDENGLPNTEDNANQFAMCKGSVPVQVYGFKYRGYKCNEPGWTPPPEALPLTPHPARLFLGPPTRF